MVFNELVISEGQAIISLKRENDDDIRVSITVTNTGYDEVTFAVPRQVLDSLIRAYAKFYCN